MRQREVQQVPQKLIKFTEEFAGFFNRSQQRHWCSCYVGGLLLDGERKSIMPMAPRIAGGDVQALQQFIDQSPWPYDALELRLAEMMSQKLDLKEPGAIGKVHVIDDTSFPKKGSKSVGVARQYCGALGKIANCQVAVTIHCGSKREHFPMLSELYLPKEWTDDQERMKRAGVPESRFTLEEKWKIALRLLKQVHHLPHEAVVFDAGYGNNREFLQELDGENEKFIAQIPETHCFWPASTETIPLDGPTKRGRQRRLPTALYEDDRAISARAWYEKLAKQPKRWKKIDLRLKDKKIVKAVSVRVREAGRPDIRTLGPERWLIIEKLADGEIRYSTSNFPASASLAHMVRLVHRRWQIEQGYQQLKEELGLDHFEGRSWRGFHHHFAMCFMAYDFLLSLKLDGRRRLSKRRLDYSESTELAQ